MRTGNAGGLRSQRERARHQIHSILRLQKGGLRGEAAADVLVHAVAEYIAGATVEQQHQLLEQLEVAVNGAIERATTARLLLEGRVST